VRWFLVVALAAAVAAPTAAAARVRFAVAVEGQVQLSWLHQASWESGGCKVTETTSGSQQIDFASRRTTKVTLTVRKGHVRFPVALLRGLTGRASGGQGSDIQTCGQTTHSDQTCGVTAFQEGTLRLSPAANGRIRLTGLAGQGLNEEAACIPRALAPAEYPPLGAALGRVGSRLLKRSKTVVGASDEAVTHLAGEGETGQLVRHVSWRVTFRRLER
jgi:hypothetical protein